MKKPITIKSNLEFVIVGPILDKDGVLIISNDYNIDLIGFAHRMYRNGKENSSYKLEINAIRSEIQYVWSNSITMGAPKRKSPLLLCWRKLNTASLKYEKRIESNFVKNKFLDFINDAYSSLKTISSSSSPIWNEGYNYEIITSTILWHISPLLLQCEYFDEEM